VTALTTLTIRNIDPAVKDRLRQVAAAHGQSMEEEVRTILRSVLMRPEPASGLASRLHARMFALGGLELELPPRAERPRYADLDGES